MSRWIGSSHESYVIGPVTHSNVSLTHLYVARGMLREVLQHINTLTHIHIYVRMVHSHDPFAHTARHVAGSPATHQHLTYLYVRMTHPHDSFAHGTACRRKSATHQHMTSVYVPMTYSYVPMIHSHITRRVAGGAATHQHTRVAMPMYTC